MSNAYGPNSGSAIYELLKNMTVGAANGDVPVWDASTGTYSSSGALSDEEAARIAADDLLRDGVEAHAATQRLMRKLTVNTEDASLVVLGDSTGNETYEWVYLLAQSLAADFPAYTVDYRLWNDGGSSFDAAVTVQTGTGAQTLTIWNGSVAGKQSMYHKGARLTPMVVTPAPDLIVINHAHNGGVNADFFRDELITLTETITSTVDAPLLIIGQNPQQDNTSMTAKVQAAAKVAASRGYGFINVHDAFLLSATPLADLMFDNVHPNIAGQLLWHATVAPSFKLAKSLVPSQQPSSLIVGAPNLMPIPLPATVGALDDWTISAQATVTIDTEVFETDGTSVKMVGDGTGSATMYVSFEEDSLDRYRGRRITFAVRLKVTEGEPSTAGRIAINDGVGTTSSSTGGPQGTAWYWSVVSHVVDAAADKLRVYLYGVTGAVAGTAYFDRASLVLGDFPADPYMPYVASAADLTAEQDARIAADDLRTLGVTDVVRTNTKLDGHSSNSIDANATQSIILGGGSDGYPNLISAAAALQTIVGGYNNDLRGALAGSILGSQHAIMDAASTHGCIAGGSFLSLYSADYSTALGGTQNIVGEPTIATDYSAAVGGEYNAIYGSHSAILAGKTNTVGSVAQETYGQYSSLLGGLDNALGTTANARFSGIVGGRENGVQAEYGGIVGSRGALVRYPGAVAQALGTFVSQGDAQTYTLVMRRSITGASLLQILIDDTYRLVLPDNASWMFEINVVGRRVDGGAAQSAAYRIVGAIKRGVGAGSTALMGTPTVTVIHEDNAAWDIDCLADATNGNLQIRASAAAGATVQYVAKVSIVETIEDV